MTGMRDVTTCADIGYGKHFRTYLSQINLVSAKNDFSGARSWTRITRECYTLSRVKFSRIALTRSKYCSNIIIN